MLFHNLYGEVNYSFFALSKRLSRSGRTSFIFEQLELCMYLGTFSFPEEAEFFCDDFRGSSFVAFDKAYVKREIFPVEKQF